MTSTAGLSSCGSARNDCTRLPSVQRARRWRAVCAALITDAGVSSARPPARSACTISAARCVPM
jgi:hypothetical protein